MTAVAIIVATWCILVRVAYRRSRRRATPRLPAALVAELRRHKLECMGEPPERVRLELLLLAGVEDSAPSSSRIPPRLSALRHRLGRLSRANRMTETTGRR